MSRRGHIQYTIEQLAFVKAGCELPRAELTVQFNARFGTDLTVDHIKSLCTRKGWLSGRTGRFDKGHINHPNARPAGPGPTSFKKGNVPATLKPLYSERLGKDGYLLIKIPEQNPYTGASTRYKFKHQWLWEQQHGPIPKGHAVVFRDGNNRNFDGSNLDCVPKAVLAQLNRILHVGDYPPELRPHLVDLAKVQVAKNKIKKRGGSRTNQEARNNDK